MSSREHGHTFANWTGVTITFLGFLIGGVALVANSPVVVVLGLVVAVAGGVIGWLLAKAGKGQPYNARGGKDPRQEAITAAIQAADKRRAEAVASSTFS
jgi:multisubunit Na+/H+ antiporter MnhG subunit